MSLGYWIVQGDKTTCGGLVLQGHPNGALFAGNRQATQGCAVSCGKHAGKYSILGGHPGELIHGTFAASTLYSRSSCPCKAVFIPSQKWAKHGPYQGDITHSKPERNIEETEHKQLLETQKPLSKINNVFENKSNIPVITNPNPINDILIKDPVKIYVMVNNVFIGHVGMVIGEGEKAILYDPAGSYTGCNDNKCSSGTHTIRGSGDFLEYPDFNWDDYLSYHRVDGDDIIVIEFIIPREQAEHITQLVYELGGAEPLFCATRIHDILKLSGGIFSSLDDPIYMRSPWELKKQLLNIYFKERGGVISGAY